MMKLQDALCYVRDFGAADFFIMVTSSSAWPDIVNALIALYSGGRPDEHDAACDHPDIVSHEFDLKLQALLKELRGGIPGRQWAVLHTIKWQRRGVPHAHILLWVQPADKPRAVDVYRPSCRIRRPKILNINDGTLRSHLQLTTSIWLLFVWYLSA